MQPVLWNLPEDYGRNFHCSNLLFPMEYSTGIDRSCGVYLPLESMLLGAPNQLLLLVALGGPIGPVGPIEAVEFNGISTELYGIIPMQPVLRVLSILPATAVAAAVAPPQSIRIETVGLGDRSGCLYRGSKSNGFQWKKRCPLF